nr:P24 [Calliteara abietis nucleopolyhedrovirus]
MSVAAAAAAASMNSAAFASFATTTPTQTAVSETGTTSQQQASQQQFQYDDENIEVVIIENSEDDRDGYVDLTAAAKLLKPIVTIRGFNKAVLWTNVLPAQKLTRNNKNYVHVNALCKYLGVYNLANATHAPQYYVLKRLIGDLIVGAQSSVVDPIQDIKSQLCTLQDCLTVNQNNNNSTIHNGGGGGGNGGVLVGDESLYRPVAAAITSCKFPDQWAESFKEIIQYENGVALNNILANLEQIKNAQTDLTNKLAFSNDTMLDSFKSLKDIVIRKK